MKLYFGHVSEYILPEDDNAIRELLGPYRAGAVLRNKTVRGRTLSFLAGMLLKKALYEEGVDITKAQFEVGEKGKPYLLGTDEAGGLHFSLSHSGELALVAICDVPVGCDIQKIEKKSKDGCLRIAGRFFTENEYNSLREMSGDEKTLAEEFHRIFSGKESFVKCTGEGMSRPFSSFEVPVEDYQIRYYGPGEVRSKLPDIVLADRYVASICNYHRQ